MKQRTCCFMFKVSARVVSLSSAVTNSFGLF